MKVSVIIPVKPGGYVAALGPLRQLAAESPEHEVIITEGKWPSRQRNQAAAAAQGDILYFLDDDAAVPPDALRRLAAAFAPPDVAVVGGPSITPAADSPFQRAIALALTSPFGGGAIRNRYRRFGAVRDTDDSELILCNLAFRREIYLANGGLDERLYPNEENELIDRLLASGARLVHDPDLYVIRSQRPTYRAFVKQMLTYGRGRAEQSLLSRSVSFKALVPAAFALYLCSLPFVTAGWYVLPALAYLLVLAVSAVMAAAVVGLGPAWRLPLVVTLLHCCYGFGFLLGLGMPRYRRGTKDASIELRRVKTFAASWQDDGHAVADSAI